MVSGRRRTRRPLHWSVTNAEVLAKLAVELLLFAPHGLRGLTGLDKAGIVGMIQVRLQLALRRPTWFSS